MIIEPIKSITNRKNNKYYFLFTVKISKHSATFLWTYLKNKMRNSLCPTPLSSIPASNKGQLGHSRGAPAALSTEQYTDNQMFSSVFNLFQTHEHRVDQ